MDINSPNDDAVMVPHKLDALGLTDLCPDCRILATSVFSKGEQYFSNGRIPVEAVSHFGYHAATCTNPRCRRYRKAQHVAIYCYVTSGRARIDFKAQDIPNVNSVQDSIDGHKNGVHNDYGRAIYDAFCAIGWIKDGKEVKP